MDGLSPRSAASAICSQMNVKHDLPWLKSMANGARHLESMRKLRDIVGANLAELRSMVK